MVSIGGGGGGVGGGAPILPQASEGGGAPNAPQGPEGGGAPTPPQGIELGVNNENPEKAVQSKLAGNDEEKRKKQNGGPLAQLQFKPMGDMAGGGSFGGGFGGAGGGSAIG